MGNFTRGDKKADRVLDQMAKYKQQRTQTEMEQVRSVYCANPKKKY